MGMPAVITQNGTGTSSIWFPDWMQAPFSVSMQAVQSNSPVYNIEYTLDNIEVANIGPFAGNANATTAANATWFQSAITAQSVSTTGTIAAPVRALRVNITSSPSNGVVTVTFIQATYPGS